MVFACHRIRIETRKENIMETEKNTLDMVKAAAAAAMSRRAQDGVILDLRDYGGTDNVTVLLVAVD